jgi:hypothetical protein
MTLVLQGKTVESVTEDGLLEIRFTDGTRITIPRDSIFNIAGNRVPIVCNDDDTETLIGHANRIAVAVDDCAGNVRRTRLSHDFDVVCAMIGTRMPEAEYQDLVRCPQDYCAPAK